MSCKKQPLNNNLRMKSKALNITWLKHWRVVNLLIFIANSYI